MIKANELRIGNWVFSNDTKMEYQVDAYGILTIQNSPDNRSPIQLTPDILEKCGFTKESNGNEYRIGLPIGHGTDLVIEVLEEVNGPYDTLISDRKADQVPNKFSYLKTQRHLHQLQNLYFALTGEELNYQP